ncbi:MAG: LysE family translocator [Alphaproteobacteria bacterium]|nr:MAG: LysE family translocator [Alphaproteobacteria bacterium]
MTDLASLSSIFMTSMGFGLAVAAPVGPMSILCIRRNLTIGWQQGVATGFGIAAGDGLYAAVAALGLTGISTFMLAYDRPLHLAAGLFLLYLGLKTFWRKNVDSAVAPVQASTLRAFWGSLLLTLTNPPTIIMFAAIFAALAPKSGFDPASAITTVAGVTLGSLVWWCFIVGGTSIFRHALGQRVRLWIDRIAGSFLMLFGVAEVRRSL